MNRATSISVQLEIARRLSLRNSRQPLWGQIFLTRRCNLRCPFCSAPGHHAEETPVSHWKEILDRLHRWGVRCLNIVGGEPTLYPHIWEFLSAARDRGFLTVLHSNLHRVQPAFENRVVESGVFAIEASLDSLDGTLPKSKWENLEVLARLRKRGIVPLVSTVITRQNISQVREIARRVTERKMVYVAAVYQRVGGLFSSDSMDLVPEQAALQPVLRGLDDLKRRSGLVRNSYSFLRNPELHANERWHCDPSYDAWVTVDSDGCLMACQEYKSSLGVLDVANIGEDLIWRNEKVSLAKRCSGCSYHCYYEAENLRGSNFLSELSSYVRAYIACLLMPPADSAINVSTPPTLIEIMRSDLTEKRMQTSELAVKHFELVNIAKK